MTETPVAHSSFVGGSTASRRINCPRSLSLEKIAPKGGSTVYAQEGTALHEMLAIILDKDKTPEELLPFDYHQPAKHDEAGNVTEQPWDYTIDEDTWDRLGQPALDMFDAFLDELEADQEGAAANYMIEEEAEFPGLGGLTAKVHDRDGNEIEVPVRGFGTSDVPFRCGKIAGIWDWKMGRKPVDAENNEQLLFYFAAILNKYPSYFEGTDRVMLCICQPQRNDQEPDVWETTYDDVQNFVLDLQDAMKEALEGGEKAHIEKGHWCSFADCKAVCPLHISAASKLGERMALMDAADKGAHDESGTPVIETIDLDAFLSEAMELAEMAKDWAGQIAAQAQLHLEAGYKVPGYKLVEKKSSGRVWTVDEDTVVSRLKSRGLKAADYYNKKVITPPAAEKLLKKLGKELPDDIVEQKPSSGYTLTRDGDPREEATTVYGKAKQLGASLLAQTKGPKSNG